MTSHCTSSRAGSIGTVVGFSVISASERDGAWQLPHEDFHPLRVAIAFRHFRRFRRLHFGDDHRWIVDRQRRLHRVIWPGDGIGGSCRMYAPALAGSATSQRGSPVCRAVVMNTKVFAPALSYVAPHSTGSRCRQSPCPVDARWSCVRLQSRLCQRTRCRIPRRPCTP